MQNEEDNLQAGPSAADAEELLKQQEQDNEMQGIDAQHS